MAPSVHAVWYGPLVAAAHDWPRDQQQCALREILESDVCLNKMPFSVVRRCQIIGSGSSFVILAELWSCGQGAARSPHDGVEALDVRVQGTPTRPERWRSATSATPVTLSPGNGLPPEPGVNLRRDQPPISFTKPVPEPLTVQVHIRGDQTRPRSTGRSAATPTTERWSASQPTPRCCTLPKLPPPARPAPASRWWWPAPSPGLAPSCWPAPCPAFHLPHLRRSQTSTRRDVLLGHRHRHP